MLINIEDFTFIYYSFPMLGQLKPHDVHVKLPARNTMIWYLLFDPRADSDQPSSRSQSYLSCKSAPLHQSHHCTMHLRYWIALWILVPFTLPIRWLHCKIIHSFMAPFLYSTAILPGEAGISNIQMRFWVTCKIMDVDPF